MTGLTVAGGNRAVNYTNDIPILRSMSLQYHKCKVGLTLVPGEVVISNKN